MVQSIWKHKTEIGVNFAMKTVILYNQNNIKSSDLGACVYFLSFYNVWKSVEFNLRAIHKPIGDRLYCDYFQSIEVKFFSFFCPRVGIQVACNIQWG